MKPEFRKLIYVSIGFIFAISACKKNLGEFSKQPKANPDHFMSESRRFAAISKRHLEHAVSGMKGLNSLLIRQEFIDEIRSIDPAADIDLFNKRAEAARGASSHIVNLPPVIIEENIGREDIPNLVSDIFAKVKRPDLNFHSFTGNKTKAEEYRDKILHQVQRVSYSHATEAITNAFDTQKAPDPDALSFNMSMSLRESIGRMKNDINDDAGLKIEEKEGLMAYANTLIANIEVLMSVGSSMTRGCMLDYSPSVRGFWSWMKNKVVKPVVRIAASFVLYKWVDLVSAAAVGVAIAPVPGLILAAVSLGLAYCYNELWKWTDRW